MRKFKLNDRLKACADMVGNSKRIIDVGTDHAYLPIWLIMNGKVKYAIASDINPLPLKKAENNIEKYNLKGCIQLLMSDGLDAAAPDKVDEIVIAGMGGELISSIISKAPWVAAKRKKLILQPMSSECDLRTYLYNNKFRIQNEKAVFSSGKVYTVISAVYTGISEKVCIEYPYIGKLGDNVNRPAVAYMERQIRNLENMNKGALSANNMNAYYRNVRIINRIKNIINNFEDG